MSGKKLFQLNYETLFVILGLIFGIAFIRVNAPFHSNDEDRHFLHAYFIASGYTIPDTKDGKAGGEIPDNLVNVVRSFQGIPFHQGTKIDKLKMERSFDQPLNPEQSSFHIDYEFRTPFLPYLPYSTGILIGKIFNSNPVWLGWFARFGGLVFYLFVMFFVLRTTPVFKGVFFLYGLTPMVLYQCSSVTYDMMTIALSFFMIAFFLKFALDENSKLTPRDLALIIIIAVLHRFAKNGYVVIPFMFFIIPPGKIAKSVKQALPIMAGMFILFIILYKLPNWTWSKVIAGLDVERGISPQKDFYKNMGENLSINLANPGMFISNLWANISHFKQEWAGGAMGRFGYSYSIMPNWFFFIHGFVLFFVALIEGKSQFKMVFWQKIITLIVAVLSIALVIVGFYVLSPVGAKMIFGLQGRYFVPIIPVALLLLYNTAFESKWWNKWGHLALTAYITIVLIYTIVFLNGALYI